MKGNLGSLLETDAGSGAFTEHYQPMTQIFRCQPSLRDEAGRLWEDIWVVVYHANCDGHGGLSGGR